MEIYQIITLNDDAGENAIVNTKSYKEYGTAVREFIKTIYEYVNSSKWIAHYKKNEIILDHNFKTKESEEFAIESNIDCLKDREACQIVFFEIYDSFANNLRIELRIEELWEE